MIIKHSPSSSWEGKEKRVVGTRGVSPEVAVTISGPSVIAGTGLGWVEDGETLRPQDISYGPHGQQSTTSFPSPPPLPPHCLIKNIWKFNWEVLGTLFDILSKLTKWEEIFLRRVLNTAESEVSSSGCLSENISPLLLISRLSTSCDWCPFYADISKPNFREFLSPPFDKFKILLKFSKKKSNRLFILHGTSSGTFIEHFLLHFSKMHFV